MRKHLKPHDQFSNTLGGASLLYFTRWESGFDAFERGEPRPAAGLPAQRGWDANRHLSAKIKEGAIECSETVLARLRQSRMFKA